MGRSIAPMSSVDPSVFTLASGQHGLLTTAQARAMGVTAAHLVTLVRTGVLTPLCRGLYAVTQTVPDDPASAHLQVAAGARLLYDDAILTGLTAVLAHRGVAWGSDLSRARILRPVQRAAGASAFHVRRTSTPTPAVPTPFGLAVPLPDALAHHAIDDGMIAGVVSADHALHECLVTSDELRAAVDRVASWPWGSRARGMLAWADGTAESVGESRCRVILGAQGVRLVPQVTISDHHGRFVARVDFVVEGTKVVVEFDGRLKYAAGDPRVLWDEKRREDELRRLGYVVVRLTWADLERPGVALAKVRRALQAA